MKKHTHLLTIFLGIFLVGVTMYRLTWGISTLPPARWDERVNVAVVTHSLETKSLPVLIYNNALFFEKPPLWYILSALLSSFGTPILLSGRLISAISGLGVVFLCVFFSWRWWGKLAALSTWITLLLSHPLFVRNVGNIFATHTFNSADLDALQIFFVMAAFLSSLYVTKNKFSAVICGIATGCAILSKGPLGLLPLIVAVLLLPYENKFTALKRLAIACIVALATMLPWYGYMIAIFGSTFVQSHFGYHIAERALIGIEGHSRSWWYYLRVLTKPGVYPLWGLVLFFFLWLPKLKFVDDTKIWFTWWICVLFFVIPTLMHTKLSWYILPLYPFYALLVGAGIGYLAKRTRKTL